MVTRQEWRNYMGFCKENELCKPFACNKALCPIGEELRKLTIPEKCKKVCEWTRQGINELNRCKDASCVIGDTIVDFRNKQKLSKSVFSK